MTQVTIGYKNMIKNYAVVTLSRKLLLSFVASFKPSSFDHRVPLTSIIADLFDKVVSANRPPGISLASSEPFEFITSHFIHSICCYFSHPSSTAN